MTSQPLAYDVIFHVGVVTLYCKGADSVIYERLSSEDQNKIKQSTTDHLNVSDVIC